MYTSRNATDSHSSHGSDDGRAEQEYNRKMLGFEKRDSLPLPSQPPNSAMDNMGGLHSSKPPPPHLQGGAPPSGVPPPSGGPGGPGGPGGLPGPGGLKTNLKKKKEEKDESDHEKSDAELVVDDTTENVSILPLII